MTFPEFQWGRFKQMLIREGRGCRDKGGTVRRTNSAALGQGPGSPSRDTQTISLSCFADTESPTRWEKLTVCCPQARRPQTGWNQKVDDADSHLPHHQPIRRMSTSWSRPLWTIIIKFVTTPSRLEHTVFEGISPLWPPLPGEAIMLFFSTSPKTLSPRFNSVLGYRGQIRLQFSHLIWKTPHPNSSQKLLATLLKVLDPLCWCGTPLSHLLWALLLMACAFDLLQRPILGLLRPEVPEDFCPWGDP